MTNQLSPDFTITGAELIAKGTDSFGFRWPYDWQQCTHGNFWESTTVDITSGYLYRINPDHLKPPKPKTGYLYTGSGNNPEPIPAIAFTSTVRRRLDADGGVLVSDVDNTIFDWCVAYRHMISSSDALVLRNKFMSLIAAGKVDIDE